MGTPATCLNPTACLYNAARRLRYLRAHPYTCATGKEPTASEAFDYALRVVLDEFMMGGTPEWMHLYHRSPDEFRG